MYSKHSALGSRILGINRNNINGDILPLERNMASSWLKRSENEGHFVEQRTYFTVNLNKNGTKEAVQR